MGFQENFNRDDLTALFSSETGHIEVQLMRLPKARLLWLNHRVMHEDRAYAECGATPEAYGQWLIDCCAYAIQPTNDDTLDLVSGICDRYGGAGIAHNGGSGRAAYIGGYHVKGIGRTPLVSVLTDDLHGTGGAYLEECVREAICAEIVAIEFPAGAVPVLAIIETGEFQTWDTDQGPKTERRCLLVRPGFVRPAHFERAPGFISADPKEGAKDAARVRKTWAAALTTCGREQLLAAYPQFWHRWALQLAYGFVHRMAHGGHTSSNIALDGRLVDFGAMAAMPSWARISTMTGGAPVGMDMHFVMLALQTQCQFWGRYLTPELALSENTSSLWRSMGDTYQEQTYVEALRVLGLSRSQSKEILSSDFGSDVRRLLARLLGHFQREQFTIFDGTPEPHVKWDVTSIWLQSAPQHLQSLRDLLLKAMGPLTTTAEQVLVGRCRLRSLNREGLYREAAKEVVYEALDGARKGADLVPTLVASMIDEYIVRHRRDCETEPDNALPIGFAQNADGAFSLFFCLERKCYFAIREWQAGAIGGMEEVRLWVSGFDIHHISFVENIEPKFIGSVFVNQIK